MAANNVLVLNGSVLGISGFAHRTVSVLSYSIRGMFRNRSDMGMDEESPDPEQLALLSMVGLLAGGLVLGLSRGRLEEGLAVQLVDVYASNTVDWRKIVAYALGGILVGFGSKVCARTPIEVYVAEYR